MLIKNYGVQYGTNNNNNNNNNIPIFNPPPPDISSGIAELQRIYREDFTTNEFKKSIKDCFIDIGILSFIENNEIYYYNYTSKLSRLGSTERDIRNYGKNVPAELPLNCGDMGNTIIYFDNQHL
jgi:hypothetical protein